MRSSPAPAPVYVVNGIHFDLCVWSFRGRSRLSRYFVFYQLRRSLVCSWRNQYRGFDNILPIPPPPPTPCACSPRPLCVCRTRHIPYICVWGGCCSTERLLFGPSLRTSLAPVCSGAAVERLAFPPSYLRSPADTDVRRPSNGARRPPAAATEDFPFHEPNDDGRDVGAHRQNYHSDEFAFPEDGGDRGILGPVVNENAYSGFTRARNGDRGQGLGLRQAKSIGRDADWCEEGEDLDSGSVAAGRRGRRQERDSCSEVVGSGGKSGSSRHGRDARGVYHGPPHPNFLFSSRAKDILSRSGNGGRR